jgi:hypothetical protein
MKTLSRTVKTRRREHAARPSQVHEHLTSTTGCRHHWVLGQPESGSIRAVCKLCGGERFYPAVLDDLDPGADLEPLRQPPGVATAVGGVRPSSVASPDRPAPDALPGDSGS